MQQELYGKQRMWGVKGDAKASDIFAWMVENGQYLDRNIEKTHELKGEAFYEPQLKECYMNALMMRSEGLSYWEGWMVSEQIPIPISHAWNLFDNQVIDFTSTLWGRDDETRIYFGVEIPKDFVMQQMLETGISGPYLYPYIMTQLNESSNSLSAESEALTMSKETFEADRSRYGNRYVTRNKKGHFKTNVSVGRSLSADRRKKSKNTPSKRRRGQQGDYRAEFEAESRFDKLQDEVARQYQEKGFDKEEAMKIGGAVAYDAGVKKYGKAGMEELSRKGRAKSKARKERSKNAIRPSRAETFATESSNSLSNNSELSDTMSNGLSNFQPMNSIIEQAPLGHGVAQDFGAEKKQGYNDRDDESIGMRHRGMHSQSMKDRRDESKGMEKSMRNRPYSDVGTMDMNAHQGYNDRDDESIGMRHRGMHSQSMKDRRDESKGMEKSMRNRPYSDVGTMDMDAEVFEAKYRVKDKNGNYWYKNSKTGANIKKLNKNRVEGNDKVRKAKRVDRKNPNWRRTLHVSDRGTKNNMAETFHADPASGATDMVAFTESPLDLVLPEGDGNVIGQSTPTTDFTPLGARAESDVGTGFMYGAGATLGVMGAVIASGFVIQGLQSLLGKN